LSGQCGAITREGGRCTAAVSPGAEWCFNHDPARADERKRNARRAGKARGGGSELKDIKREIRAVIGGVLSEKVDKGVGAVALQGFNTLLRAVEIQQKADLDELAAEVEDLKRGISGAA
jgi:hypothetical protein